MFVISESYAFNLNHRVARSARPLTLSHRTSESLAINANQTILDPIAHFWDPASASNDMLKFALGAIA
jgi:hypothetical protein